MSPPYRALWRISKKMEITGDPLLHERVALMVLTTHNPENDDQLDVPRDDILGYIFDMSDIEWDITMSTAEERIMNLPMEHFEHAVSCSRWIRHIDSMRAFR
jgi:hypothetical protein